MQFARKCLCSLMFGRFYLLPCLEMDYAAHWEKTHIKASINLGEGSEINVGLFMFYIKLKASTEASAVILWATFICFLLLKIWCLIKVFQGMKCGQRYFFFNFPRCAASVEKYCLKRSETAQEICLEFLRTK